MINDKQRLFAQRVKQAIEDERRVNNNIFKVQDENSRVKSLLSLAVQSAKPKHDTDSLAHINYDMKVCSKHTKRKDLIRTALLLATSRNTSAQENLINVVSDKIGRIRDKEFHEISKLLSVKPDSIAQQINQFLCLHINGYSELYNKYSHKYYGL
jgi:hypothetical protein